MDTIYLEKTNSTPEIFFDGNERILFIKGESFPENSAKFYTPVINWLEQYLAETDKELVMHFEIIYFNSSTSKIFMSVFDMLEAEVGKGKKITVNWYCDKDNEIALECGEEFKEDLELLPFNILIK